MARENFNRPWRIVAGVVPVTPNYEARQENKRGGRDKPGHGENKSASA